MEFSEKTESSEDERSQIKTNELKWRQMESREKTIRQMESNEDKSSPVQTKGDIEFNKKWSQMRSNKKFN